MKRNQLNAAAILLLFAASMTAPAQADAIRLLASVRLPAGAEAVRLADIAQLEGAEAEQYADLVIAELNGDGVREISIRQVRQMLDEAGAHWGRINLNGRAVIIRPHRSTAASAPGAMSPVSLTTRRGEAKRDRRDDADDHPAASIINDATLRGAIARHVARGLAVDPADLRLVFDAADGELLDRSDESCRFELKPECSLRSERITFTVRLWSDHTVIESAQIALRPMVRLRAAVLQRDLERDEMIDRGDFIVAEQWLSPLQAQLTCDPGLAVGRLAERRLKAGDVLREKNVRRPTVIERGERVIVRCLVGGVVISLQAEACADGAPGEMIEFRKLGERDTFLATVTDGGEAVIDLSS